MNSKNHVGLATTGGFWSHARMRYLGGIVALALSISILIEGGGGVLKRIGEIGSILSIVYLCAMIYVSVVFVKAKKINHS